MTYLGSVAARSGIPIRVVVVATAVICSLPLLGAFTSTAWKDVPYAVGVLLAAGAIWSISGRVKPSKSDQLLALLSLVVVSGFRWNGFIAALVIAGGFVAVVPQGWRARTALAGIGAISVGVATLVLPTRLELVSDESSLAYVGVVHDLAVVARRNPAAFSDAEWRVMQRVMVRDEWTATGASCASIDLIVHPRSGESDPVRLVNLKVSISRNHQAIARIWSHHLRADPVSLLRSRLCRMKSAVLPFPVDRTMPIALWQFGDPVTDGRVAPGMSHASTTPLLWPGARWLVEHSNTSFLLQWALFRAPVWLVLSGVVLVAFRRRFTMGMRRSVLLAVPAVGVVAAAAAAMGAQDLRYTFPAAILLQYWCLLVVGSLLVGVEDCSPRVDEPGPELTEATATAVAGLPADQGS